MKNIIMLNLSPKGENSNSLVILSELAKNFEKQKNIPYKLSTYSLRKFNNTKEELLSYLRDADDIIFATPLYVDTLPSYVISFLDYLSDNLKASKPINIYGVVNCGFLESYYNLPAIHVLENFSNELSLNWRFGMGLGCGELIGSTKDGTPIDSFMKADIILALESFTEAFFKEHSLNRDNILATAKLPKRVYALMAEKNFKALAKKNKAKIKSTPHLIKK